MCLLLDMLFLPLYYADVCVIGFSRLLRLFPVKLRVLLPSPLLPFTTSHLLRTTPGKCHFSDTKSKVLLPLLFLQKSYLLMQIKLYSARARSTRARRACALRALGLLLADGTPTVGGGKTF